MQTTSKYPTCELQISESSTVNAICFSPKKVQPLKLAQQQKSPVKIKRFEYNQQFNNVVLNNTTTLEIIKEPLTYQPMESTEDTLLTITYIKQLQEHKAVSLKAKVMNLSAIKTIKLKDGPCAKAKATIVDPTDSVTVVFWGEWANKITDDTTYIFKNLKVRKDPYTSEMYLNTPQNGFGLEEAEQFTDPLSTIRLSLMNLATKTVNVAIIGVKMLQKYFNCAACGKKAEVHDKLLKCTACRLKQRITSASEKWFAKILVEDMSSNTKMYLSVFDSEIRKILKECDVELSSDMTEEQVTDCLLTSPNINIR